VSVDGAGLAIGTEISVVADSTLVADATDVGWVRFVCCAQGAITADANVNRGRRADRNTRKLLVDGHEAVVRVSEAGVQNAEGAVVPVWAIQTLVANASNVLVTSIADSLVNLVAARSHLHLDMSRHLSLCHGGREAVAGVVTVNVLAEAGLAKIIVLTYLAVEELLLRVLLNAAVAGAHHLVSDPLLRSSIESRLGNGGCHSLLLGLNSGLNSGLNLDLGLGDRLGLSCLGLGVDTLGSALHKAAINGGALDQPVIVATAGDAVVDAGLA
jgi:hypothetical protein